MDQQVRELMSIELRDKRKTFDKLSHYCNMTNKKSTEIDVNIFQSKSNIFQH